MMITLQGETFAEGKFREVKIPKISGINFREWPVTMLFAKI